MAFKPFDYFRKHQKTVFAIMAIVCMLVFIFSGFGGDPLKRLVDYVGSGKARGDVVATMYKEDVHTQDVQDLRDQRQLASDFLSFRFFSPLGGAYAEAKQESEKALKGTPVAQRIPLLSEILMHQSQPDALKNRDQILNDIERLERFILSPAGTALSSPESKAVSDLLFVLRCEAYMRDPQRRPNEFLFGGTSSVDDLLDHKIWLHQADRLGIDFVEDDLRKIINFDAGREVVPKDKEFAADENVKMFLQSRKHAVREVKPADLVQALTNEYRACVAQGVLLGREPGLRGALTPLTGFAVPVGSVTLQEFAARYRAQQTQVDVAMLPIPTEAFRSRVEGHPTPQELQDLYNRYRKDLARPDSSVPGLKIPRKLKVQYLSLPAELPAFKEIGLAHELTQTQLVQRILANASPRAAGGGVAAAVPANFLPLFDGRDSLLKEYTAYVNKLREQRWSLSLASNELKLPDWLLSLTGPKLKNLSETERQSLEQHWVLSLANGDFNTLHPQSVVNVTTRPAQVAALVALPALRSNATPLVFSNSFLAAVVRSEMGERKYQIAGVGNIMAAVYSASVVPFQNPLQPFANVPTFQATDPPFPTMAPVLWNEVLNKATLDAYTEELSAFADQLARLRNNPEEANRFLERVNEGKPVKVEGNRLAEAVTLKEGDPLLKEDRSLKVGDMAYTFHLKDRIHSMTSPGDRARVEASPELAGLLKAFAALHKPTPASTPNGLSKTTLADHVFEPTLAPYEVEAWSPRVGGPDFTGGPELRQFITDPSQIAQFRPFALSKHIRDVAAQTFQDKDSKEAYLFWYSDAQPEKEPTTLEAVRPEAVRAWQTLRARRKAQEAATEIKKALTRPSGPGQQVEVEKALQEAVARIPGLKEVLGGQKLVVLSGVTEVTPTNVARAGVPGPTVYEPYKPSEIDIKYPRPSLADQLLTLQKPGDAIIVSDQPEDSYYVAVLIDRREPTAAMFEEALRKVAVPFFDSFWSKQVLEPRREAYRNDLLRQLRVEAVGADKVDENGKYILPESVRKGTTNNE